MKLFSQKTSAFGIDFSEASLKMAKLEKREGFFNLVSFNEIKIPSGVIIESEVREPKALAKIIKQAMAEASGKKITDKYAVISLPEEKSFLDVFQLPHLADNEIEEAVRYEAENHIPMGVDDVYFDFEIIPSLDQNSKFQEVMVAAVPRLIVDSYLTTLHLAGLKAKAAEIECLSVVRSAVSKEDSRHSLLVIDFGESRITFIIFAENSARFTSTIPISSRMITENIAKKMNLGFRKAEELKINDGLLGDKNVAEAALPCLNDLIVQINNHLKYYYSHEAKDQSVKKVNNNLEKILLTGGGANLKGLADFLSSSLNMPAEIANPWINVMGESMKEVPGLSFEQSLGYTTTLGLALRAVKQ